MTHISTSPVRISVVVCVYNSAHFLGQALRSVAGQTMRDFELIVVDDGSTDNIEEVVAKWRPCFSNCRFLPRSHSGLAASRNFGICSAAGTHVAFIDADDVWAPQYLDAVCNTYRQIPDADIVCFNGIRAWDNGNYIGPFHSESTGAFDGRIQYPADTIAFARHAFPSATSFRKSLFNHIGDFDSRYSITHDWHWVIRAALAGAHCIRQRQQLALYRHHEANLSGNAQETFRQWLSIYRETLSKAPGARDSCLQFTRSWLTGLLSKYSGEVNRRLLNEAIQVFGNDAVLRTAYISTYLGSTSVLKSMRSTKHWLKAVAHSNHKINWDCEPEEIFARMSV